MYRDTVGRCQPSKPIDSRPVIKGPQIQIDRRNLVGRTQTGGGGERDTQTREERGSERDTRGKGARQAGGWGLQVSSRCTTVSGHYSI